MTSHSAATATQLDPGRIPAHIAIIMDGNGRWAKARGLDRSEGHAAGVTAVRRITEEASRLGVKWLTLYTFSTENWNRPAAEVDALMHLIGVAIERETPDLIKNNVRLSVIGDFDRMPPDPRSRLARCMADTSHCDGLNLVLALSYSARWEIARAASRIAADALAGRICPDAVDAETFSRYLDTAGIPDPDLLIRTGGNVRVSNFLLWQIAYSEIVFTDTYWPDFDATALQRAIAEFQSRERRFGLTSEQIHQS